MELSGKLLELILVFVKFYIVDCHGEKYKKASSFSKAVFRTSCKPLSKGVLSDKH
jgi:hypothetical protein